MGVCKSIVTTLYGELQHEQLVQASILGAACFVVGIYWMMRSLKDSVFATLVGLEYQPQAKMLSLFVVPPCSSYNKVVDLVERNRPSPSSAARTLSSSRSPSASSRRRSGCTATTARRCRRAPSGCSAGSTTLRSSRTVVWRSRCSGSGPTRSSTSRRQAQYGIIVAGGQIGAIAGCTLVVGSNTSVRVVAQFSARNSSARNSSARRRRSQASPSCTPSAACARSSRR